MQTTSSRIKIGTRGSKLAIAQAKIVAEGLGAGHGGPQVEVVTIRTLGDRLPPDRFGKPDGKSAFTGEIERKLIDGEIDAAVHSLKDLPTDLDPALIIGAMPRRGDPRDALVTHSGTPLSRLADGARLGTSSIRRRAQLLSIRPGLEVVEVHGNVETRLKKVEDGDLDGVVLAAAGLQRIGMQGRVTEFFAPELMIPAVCQGTIAVEARKDDMGTLELLRAVDDPETRAASECERAFARRLGGDCTVPLGGYAQVLGRTLTSLGLLASVNGERISRSAFVGSAEDPVGAGTTLGDRLLEAGGKEILTELAA
jgi:hydroxymethylbilane synthase